MAFKKIRLPETVALLDRPPVVEGLGLEAAQVIKFWTVAVLFACAMLGDEKVSKSQTPETRWSGAARTRSSRPTEPFEYVFEIVDYLLRYDRYPDGRGRFTLEDAKDYAWAKRGKVLKVRTLAKYWEENRLAAPYIYAFLRHRSFRATDETRPQEVINWLTVFFRRRATRKIHSR